MIPTRLAQSMLDGALYAHGAKCWHWRNENIDAALSIICWRGSRNQRAEAKRLMALLATVKP